MDFARLFAALPARFLILTPDAPRFTIVSASDAYLEATGTRLDEIVGRGIFEVFPDDPRNPDNDGPRLLRASLLSVRESGAADRMPMVRYDVGAPGADGAMNFEERYWTPINSPVFDGQGRMLYLVHRVEDTTEVMRSMRASEAQRERTASLEKSLGRAELELMRHSEDRRRTQEALAASEHRFRSLVTNIAGMLYRVQAQPPWQFVYVSEGVERLCGYPPSYFVEEGHPWASVVFEEDAARINAELVAQDAAGRPMQVEYRIRHRDGSLRWVEGRVRAARDVAHEYEGTVFDIDDRKRAEFALQESQEHFRHTTQSVPSVLWTARADGTLDFVSDAALEQMGAPPERLRETGWLSILHPDDIEPVSAAWHASLTTGAPYFAQLRLRGSDDEYRTFQARAQPRFDADGRIQRWYGVSTNIDDMRRAQASAEDASRAKSAFLSTMSHEIRTPLNAVLGFAGLLADTELGSQQRDFVNSIRASGDHLLGVINDILDFSRLESRSMALDYAPCDLRHLIESALDMVANQAAPKNLELVYDIDDGVPPACLADQARLRQVLANLLGNAVKFTSRGEVTVRLSARALEDQEHEFVFAVRDTGIGIPADRLDRLFRDFSQVDDSVSRRFGGTGLGLAISKRLVEAHGGTMSVESTPGHGSTFSFRIRAIGTPTPQPPPAMTADALRGRRVLIVDDNRANLEILRLQTRAWGMDPVCLADPTRALDLVQDMQARGEAFDLAILDYQMPGFDGVRLAKSLRAHSPLPLILLSSLTTTSEAVRSAGADFAAVLTKPVHRSALLESVGVAVEPRRVPVAPAALAEGSGMPPMRLLLAEDNVVNRKVALLLLRKLGYADVDVATDGVEALEAVSSRAYDVVLMDIEMPRMDGLAASRSIRQSVPADRQPHIVAMTANAMAEDRDACTVAGMDDYVAKPVDPELLRMALTRAARSRGIAAPATPPRRTSLRAEAEVRAQRIAEQVLAGGGEMGAMMRSIDWSQSSLGPVYTWPQSLRTALSILLTQKHPIFLWWGRELIQFYNDAYRPILGATKHPRAMGQRGRECWSDIWSTIEPMLDGAMNRGESSMVHRGLLCLDRNGLLEESYFTYGYSPIRDESGGVGGVFVACSENTAEVLAARRSSLLLEIDAGEDGAPDRWQDVGERIGRNPHDLPFALVYRLDADAGCARLLCASGLAAGSPAAPRTIAPVDPSWPLFGIARSGCASLADSPTPLPVLPPWPEPPLQALLQPIGADRVLVAGLSPRLILDAAYRGFIEKLADRLARLR